jgi:general secretion pathway protein A
MYAAHFGLKREPFSLAPDPRFLFMSERHREALAHLLYGVRGGGGFVLLTGEIGAGKTTVVRCLLEQLPAECVVAYIVNPRLTALELLQTVCQEFGVQVISESESGKVYVDALNSFLLAAHAKGQQALLVIDEAQALEPTVLEQLRLLTNLETAKRKLLQIVLVGQPELRQMLAAPGLEQLAQRVVARYHLGPLSAKETRRYVRHRLGVAGRKGDLPFDTGALTLIHKLSAGVPRRINLLADRGLLGAYARHQQTVDKTTVQHAADEVFAAPAAVGLWAKQPVLVGAAALLLALLAAAALGWAWRGPITTPALAVAPPASVPSVAPAVSAPVVPVASAASAAAAAAAPAAASAPVSAAAPSDDAAELLVAAHGSEAIAWRELGLRWNLAIGEGEPCVAVLQAQTACFKSPAGGLQTLRQLGRPALLALRPENGPRVYALLVALAEDQATLQVGTRRFVLTLPALARVWRGEFNTLWRTPPGWRGTQPVEKTPAARDWVQQQLARLMPAMAARPWADRVSAFQVLQGLPVDGRAGAVTLMQLNRAAGIDEPRLLDSKSAAVN